MHQDVADGDPALVVGRERRNVLAHVVVQADEFCWSRRWIIIAVIAFDADKVPNGESGEQTIFGASGASGPVARA